MKPCIHPRISFTLENMMKYFLLQTFQRLSYLNLSVKLTIFLWSSWLPWQHALIANPSQFSVKIKYMWVVPFGNPYTMLYMACIKVLRKAMGYIMVLLGEYYRSHMESSIKHILYANWLLKWSHQELHTYACWQSWTQCNLWRNSQTQGKNIYWIQP